MKCLVLLTGGQLIDLTNMDAVKATKVGQGERQGACLQGERHGVGEYMMFGFWLGPWAETMPKAIDAVHKIADAAAGGASLLQLGCDEPSEETLVAMGLIDGPKPAATPPKYEPTFWRVEAGPGTDPLKKLNSMVGQRIRAVEVSGRVVAIHTGEES